MTAVAKHPFLASDRGAKVTNKLHFSAMDQLRGAGKADAVIEMNVEMRRDNEVAELLFFDLLTEIPSFSCRIKPDF